MCLPSHEPPVAVTIARASASSDFPLLNRAASRQAVSKLEQPLDEIVAASAGGLARVFAKHLDLWYEEGWRPCRTILRVSSSFSQIAC